jgi:hypothetical protein
MVVHACDSSYKGGRGRRIVVWGWSLVKGTRLCKITNAEVEEGLNQWQSTWLVSDRSWVQSPVPQVKRELQKMTPLWSVPVSNSSQSSWLCLFFIFTSGHVFSVNFNFPLCLPSLSVSKAGVKSTWLVGQGWEAMADVQTMTGTQRHSLYRAARPGCHPPTLHTQKQS